jgi:hypothetical protein
MLGHREMTMEDYADIFKRRFWLILTSGIFFWELALASPTFYLRGTSRRHWSSSSSRKFRKTT